MKLLLTLIFTLMLAMPAMAEGDPAPTPPGADPCNDGREVTKGSGDGATKPADTTATAADDNTQPVAPPSP